MRSLYGYAYLSETDILNYSDVLTIISYIEELAYLERNDFIEGKINFLERLGNSIIQEIGGKYGINDYLSFKGVDFSYRSYLKGLRRIRSAKVEFINTFSGSLVGDPLYVSNSINSNIKKKIESEKDSFFRDVESFSSDISRIDNIISNYIGEKNLKNGTFLDIKKKYMQNLDFNEVQDKYFGI